MKTDYEKYRFNAHEWILVLAQAGLLFAAVDYIFYQSLWVCILFFPYLLLFIRYQKQKKIQKRKKIMHYQFKDALSSLGIALRAGYSLENAVAETAKDLKEMFGEKQDIVREFSYMVHQLHVNISLEQLLKDWGQRSHIEDISNFAVTVVTVKRTGGDIAGILQKSSRMLEDKIGVKKEIEASIAGRKMEQKVMSLMPAGIILYMRISSPGFMDVLYGNLFGAGIMSICLITYLFAWRMGEKIVDIEV